MSKQEEIKQLLIDRAKFTERLESTNSYNLADSSVTRLQSIDERIALLVPALLEENEQLEKRNQELDAWATEGYEENQKLVDERDRLRERFEEKNSRHTTSIRLLVHVTDILSMGRTPDRAGAALKEIYKWLHENNPVGQEGEGNQ